MYELVIYDDDAASAADIAAKVEALPCAGQLRVHTATTAEQLNRLASKGMQAHIFIADVLTPEDQPGGIDFVKDGTHPLLTPRTQVIYASGHLETAPEVYDTNHVYFLLKPVSTEKLQKALDLAFEALSSATNAPIKLKFGRGFTLVYPTSIKYIESNLRKLTVHTVQEDLQTYAKLEEVQKQLPPYFVRCHQSYLVNLAFMENYKNEGITMLDGTIIPVSRARAKEVQDSLLHFLHVRNAH
ncbi:MAG: LytTR family DNA-binding domain-containing protein [Coriobacteriia bacterium]|nr:LytTR family DNA-binding domain-containing protein [Coriobacteriia bacterium]